jgi:hypothetical protein
MRKHFTPPITEVIQYPITKCEVYTAPSMDQPSIVLDVNGVNLVEFPNFIQESTVFVSIRLPNNTRVFNWFEGTDSSDSIYSFAQQHLGTSPFSLIDRDVPSQSTVPLNQPISKALLPIHQGSTRNRFRLEVTTVLPSLT